MVPERSYRQGALADGGEHHLFRDHRVGGGEAQAVQSGAGKDYRVSLTLAHLTDPGIHVAPYLYYPQVRTVM